MRIAKGILLVLTCLPFALVFAVGAALVGVSLFFIYLLIALVHPTEAEWSA